MESMNTKSRLMYTDKEFCKNFGKQRTTSGELKSPISLCIDSEGHIQCCN